MLTYRLVLHNDEEHTFDYVQNLLMRLGVSAGEAAELTSKVDKLGRAYLPAPTKEAGFTLFGTALAAGPDARIRNCPGSLMVSVEEIDDFLRPTALACGRVTKKRGFERLDADGIRAVQDSREPVPLAVHPRGDFSTSLCSPSAHRRNCPVAALRFSPQVELALFSVLASAAVAALVALCMIAPH